MDKLLILKLSSLGDVIHTLPAAQALRTAFPNAHLAWAVERTHSAVLAGQPWLNEVIIHDRRNARTYVDFIRRLRSTRWDAVIDFQGLLRSGFAAFLSGARRRIGHAPCREPAHWFYNERVPRGTLEQHAVDRYYHLATHVGGHLAGMPLDRPYLHGRPPQPWIDGPRLFPLYPSQQDRDSVAAWLSKHNFDPNSQKLVVLHSHARRLANLWPTARYAELARELLQQSHLRVVLTGGPAAKPLCDAIAAGSGGDVWRADGALSLLASADLIRQAAVMVTCDSGPMHLAAAVGTPIVALFGPTNPLRTGPYCTNAIAIDRRLPCGHCKGKTCPRKLDPPECMAEIRVSEVCAAVEQQLHSHKPPLNAGTPAPHFAPNAVANMERSHG